MVTRLIGVRIRELRQRTGLSQEAFANKYGLARTYFNEVESGKRNVSVRNLMKIVNGLGVTLVEFFDTPLFDPLYPSLLERQSRQLPSETDYAAIDLPTD